MGKINRDWHEAHPMPQRATLEQRIVWHREHAEYCGCREMPAQIRQEIDRRAAGTVSNSNADGQCRERDSPLT
jgi:hypothetical protein